MTSFRTPNPTPISPRQGMGDWGADLYLNCETCVRLWSEYGAAMLEMRSPPLGPNREASQVKRRRFDAVLRAMRAHEAEAHLKARATASGA
jgi:hypothetical protein